MLTATASSLSLPSIPKSMAKFSLDDADDDPPVATARDKRKRDDGPADAEDEPPRARGSAVAGREPAAPGAEAEAAGRRGPAEEMANGEVEGGLSVQIDPDVLDCSICFESLRPPLYQVLVQFCAGIWCLLAI